ncbi:Cof-type HAD-IIB family hydrolase [Mycoplasma todarodis]
MFFYIKYKYKGEYILYKLIAFDIDGTILPHGDVELSPEILKMFEDLKKAGYVTAFVTGREFITINKMIDTPNVDYFLGANGTFIYDMKKKETLWEKVVPFYEYKNLEKYCEENNINLSVITQHSVFFRDKGSYQGNWFWDQFYDLIKPLDDDKIQKEDIHQITVRTTDTDEQKQVLEFVKTLSEIEVNTTWPQGMFVGPTGVNKASGLKRLGDRINIKLEEMVAFGDGSNDFEMLKEVGYGVAMEIADDDLKAVANDTCGKAADFGPLNKLKEMKIL